MDRSRMGFRAAGRRALLPHLRLRCGCDSCGCCGEWRWVGALATRGVQVGGRGREKKERRYGMPDVRDGCGSLAEGSRVECTMEGR